MNNASVVFAGELERRIVSDTGSARTSPPAPASPPARTSPFAPTSPCARTLLDAMPALTTVDAVPALTTVDAVPVLTAVDAVPMVAAANLHGVFQSIVDVANCVVFGHEGLIRGRVNSPVHLPAALFREANAAGLGDELEFTAAELIMASYRRHRGAHLLFVNFSARAITRMGS